MIINYEKMKYYFLTYKNETRKQHMLEEFKQYDITAVDSFSDTSKHKSGAIGFSKLLDLACLRQEKDKPFQPFCMMEDDVKKYREFPNTLEIPNDADILYIGLSVCGMRPGTYCYDACYTNVNEEIIKLQNMLALHGLIICSQTGLNAFKASLIKDFESDQPWDISIAKAQPYYNIFALRKPLVFQKAELGGQEELTKIEYEDYEHCNPNKST